MRLALPLLLVCAAVAAAATPRDVWKAGIAAQNKDYAAVPHAMLKIQDSVYLGEGQAAGLSGKPGDAASWRWHPGGRGALRVAYRGGKLTASLNGKPLAAAAFSKGVAIDKDVDVTGQPTQVGAGVPGWRLFVFNQKARAAHAFKGVSYYPYDPAFRVSADFAADPKLPPRVFRTSRGTDKQFFHAGDARFVLKGKTVTLPFYAGSRDPKQISDISAFFTDGLTGRGAYGAGRYNDVADFGKFPPRRVLIDFNNSYNPNCARSSHFTCPVAVDSIPLDVMAGERDPRAAH
jgi:uncharacterized protein (DUF1684 family)